MPANFRVGADFLSNDMNAKKKRFIQTLIPRGNIAWRLHKLRASGTDRKNRNLFSNIDAYCMFIGYPRSGHTLVGALLNAHPEAVIAQELDALSYVDRGISRERLFALLLERDRWFSRSDSKGKYYGYHVPNQWQGRIGHLRVIGDKKGGASTRRLLKNPQLLSDLRCLVGIPVRIIHIVRNPYDNISTISVRNEWSLEKSIHRYFLYCDFISDLISKSSESDLITLRHEDFIEKPKENLQQLCSFLGLTGAADYLGDCAGIVFEAPSKTRSKVRWPDVLIKDVDTRMAKIPFLHDYSFG